MSATSYRLTCEGLGHRFGSRRLFADLSFALDSPGSVCIAGPNGSGKSTLLRILVGLLTPTRGQVQWHADGRPLAWAEVRARLGLVSPDLQLYGELTAAENLAFFARLRRLPGPDRDWSERLAGVGLEGRSRDRVGNFSSGQKQRMKYLVATIHDPPFLLLDEPTANLDLSGRSLVCAFIEAQRRDRLLIVATNEEKEYDFGDRLVRVG